eukprot:TRINITY_DN71_c0_g3_i1.p1 TRINITY_DN71_c0_g3~~TRINITY_DN71_c0_g3_i1.p1  ORF type:complete len:553 (-),score=28.00 TRINITY_DN71_c0_g3_i1:180-1796(-)
MIQYSSGTWSLLFALRWRGSVLPKAFALAFPNAVLAYLLQIYMSPAEGEVSIFKGCEIFWSGYTFVLGFLLVFRNNQAYNRFWEGSLRIQQIRGEWLNAFSNILAFSSTKAPAHEVDAFNHMMARFLSLLHCSALQQVAELDDDTMEVLDCSGFDSDPLEFLQDTSDRCEIILQWVQRATIEAASKGIIDVAPPILSRVFQEFSHGIVNLNQIRQLKEIPFPFPYSQTLTYLLVIHWIATPVLASQFMSSATCAAIVSFVVISAYWSPLYIALEIDQPFGADANDLPVKMLQADMNDSLLQLLHPMARSVPGFRMTRASLSKANNCQSSQDVLSTDRNKAKQSIMNRHESVFDETEGESSFSGVRWSFLRKPSVLGESKGSESNDSNSLSLVSRFSHAAACMRKGHAPQERPSYSSERSCYSSEHSHGPETASSNASSNVALDDKSKSASTPRPSNLAGAAASESRQAASEDCQPNGSSSPEAEHRCLQNHLTSTLHEGAASNEDLSPSTGDPRPGSCNQKPAASDVHDARAADPVYL